MYALVTQAFDLPDPFVPQAFAFHDPLLAQAVALPDAFVALAFCLFTSTFGGRGLLPSLMLLCHRLVPFLIPSLCRLLLSLMLFATGYCLTDPFVAQAFALPDAFVPQASGLPDTFVSQAFALPDAHVDDRVSVIQADALELRPSDLGDHTQVWPVPLQVCEHLRGAQPQRLQDMLGSPRPLCA